jgi:hypothetical protein
VGVEPTISIGKAFAVVTGWSEIRKESVLLVLQDRGGGLGSKQIGTAVGKHFAKPVEMRDPALMGCRIRNES